MKKRDLYNLYQDEIDDADDASESEKVDAKDDEEIDEEMVFNESDEERFGSYFPAKDDDSSADEEDEEEYDQDDGGNISDLLKRENLQDLITAQDESFGLEEFSDSESDGSVKDLSSIVSKKRKVIDLNAKQSEFSIPVGGKVSLSDMMQSVQEETGFGALKKKLKNLDNTTKIDAPAATRIKNRMERIAAYEEANKKISKWTPLVKKNREADHLNFEDDKGINMTSSAMVSQFNPTTDMEMEIQNLIKESGMGQNEVAENEELKLVQLSKEELMERQKELSKMRALCFFKEQKQKKIAKIKSKVYRKLHRKKKGDDLDLDELKRIDPQLAEERVQKLELERAKERVSLKHKNTSKWAKQMLNRKDNDPETRIALMRQLEKHQQLKKRITGMDSDESDQNIDHDEDENLLNQLDDLENDIDNVETPLKGLMGMKFMQKGLQRQKNEMKELIEDVRNLEDSDDEASEKENGSSIYTKSQMDEKETSELSDGYLSNESDFKEDEHQHSIQTSGPITVGNIKQLKPLFEVKPFEIKDQKQNTYFGNVNTSKNFTEESDNETSDTENQSDLESEHSIDVPKSSAGEADGEKEESAITNPWLQSDFSEPLQKSAKADRVDGMVRSVLKLEKHKKKLEKPKDESMIRLEIEKDDDRPQDHTSNDAGSDDESINPADEKSHDLGAKQLSDDETNSDEDLNVIHSTDINKLSREDIMRLTFENDNVIEEFEDEKKKIVERDMPKKEDLTLPGWGSWGGVGLKPQKQPKVVKSIPGIEIDKRKDAKLKHVIINEKRLKKSVQYLVPQVPHGFENRDQYERTIRMPIGKEWNTQNVYLEKIAPRIHKKLGQAIQPIKFVSSGKKTSGRRKL